MIPGFLEISARTRTGLVRNFTVNAEEVRLIGTDGREVWLELKSQDGHFTIDEVMDSYQHLLQKLKDCLEAKRGT